MINSDLKVKIKFKPWRRQENGEFQPLLANFEFCSMYLHKATVKNQVIITYRAEVLQFSMFDHFL